MTGNPEHRGSPGSSNGKADDPESRQTRFAYRRAFEQWLGTIAWSHMATLSSNGVGLADMASQAGPESTRRAIEWSRGRLLKWEARINRRFLGRNWINRPAERLFAFAALENTHRNGHWHVLMCIPASISTLAVSDAVDDSWRALVHGGNARTETINDAQGAIRYVTKSLVGGRVEDRWHFLGPESARPPIIRQGPDPADATRGTTDPSSLSETSGRNPTERSGPAMLGQER